MPLGVLGDLRDHRGSPAVIIEHLDRDDAFGSWVVKNDNAHADLRTRPGGNSGRVRMEVVENGRPRWEPKRRPLG